jgi:pimeloyl-ACP methyl ester carboxylesterase
MDDWDPALIEALAAMRQVITFDSPGVGETGGTTPATLEEAADIAAFVVRTLPIGQADFLGWSMGGMTAQILALRHPNLVRRLVLAGTLPPGGSPEVVPSPPNWSQIAGKPDYEDEDILRLFFTESAGSRAAGRASLDRLSRPGLPGSRVKTSPATMQAQLQAIIRFYKNEGGWYERLGEIVAPTLVANGDRDGAFPVIDSLVLAREIPGAQLLIYPDAGHGFLFQDPARFAADVSAFLGR